MKPKRPSKPYVHPIPSRVEIVAALEEAQVPLALKPLAKRLGVHQQARQGALDRRLRAMVRDGRLIRNRAKEYCLVERLDLVTGTVSAHRDGYGFLIPDDGSSDLFLPARQMRQLFHGDRIAARVRHEDEHGKREGQLVEVLERGVVEVVGRFRRERGIDEVIPDSKNIVKTLLIPRGAGGGATNGAIVKAEVTEYPTVRAQAVGRVVEVLGDDQTPGIEIDSVLFTYGIPHEWPQAVEAEAQSLGDANSIKRRAESI